MRRLKIFGGESEVPAELFNAAVGYELLNDDIREAERLAKDYIDLQEKECRVIDEFLSQNA